MDADRHEKTLRHTKTTEQESMPDLHQIQNKESLSKCLQLRVKF